MRPPNRRPASPSSCSMTFSALSPIARGDSLVDFVVKGKRRFIGAGVDIGQPNAAEQCREDETLERHEVLVLDRPFNSASMCSMAAPICSGASVSPPKAAQRAALGSKTWRISTSCRSSSALGGAEWYQASTPSSEADPSYRASAPGCLMPRRTSSRPLPTRILTASRMTERLTWQRSARALSSSTRSPGA